MQRTVLFLLVCMLSCVFGFAQSPTMVRQVRWLTNYDQAMQQSKSSSKPVAILFTGTDWCTWCKKLEQEVLTRPEFADVVDDRIIFVKLDFPMNKPLPPQETARNKEVQKMYSVAGYPTVVLLDGQTQRLIGTVGYRPGGPKAYGEYLLKMVGDHDTYQKNVQNLDKKLLSGVELKQLYEQAMNIGRTEDAQQILLLGAASDQMHFFLLERYRLLAEQGHLRDQEALNIRDALLKSDPDNLMLTHYQIALIDFEAISKENGNAQPELTVASLVEYIDKFGTKDKDNLWRMQMIISQVFLDQDKIPEALRYARSSYQSAPPAVQSEISIAIKHMQSLCENM